LTLVEQLHTTLSADLICAYESANYHVRSEKPFIMEVNKRSDRLSDLFWTYRVSCAAFITAYNPLSKPLPYEENQLRNKNLKSDVESMGLILISGYGQDSLGEWDREDSFLIFGLNLPDAKILGLKYEQNAIPNLILLN